MDSYHSNSKVFVIAGRSLVCFLHTYFFKMIKQIHYFHKRYKTINRSIKLEFSYHYSTNSQSVLV